MALEKGSGMTARQKATAGAFVLILIIIGWLIFGGGEKPVAPQPAKPPATTAMKGGNMTMMPPSSPAPNMAGNGAAVTMASNDNFQPRPASVPKDPELLKLQELTQEKYINALNELQMLKVQRDIAESNQAIAAAKLATVTAEKNINDLLTRPVLASGAPANIGPPIAGASTPSPLNQPLPQSYVTEIPYVVTAVSWQVGKWHALINYQGKNYNVCNGDVLPVDGSVVVKITSAGVVLKRDTVIRKIGILTTL